MTLLSPLAWEQAHSIMIMVNIFSVPKTVGTNRLTRNLCATSEGEIQHWRESLNPEICASRTY